jgi:hypothetical protein
MNQFRSSLTLKTMMLSVIKDTFLNYPPLFLFSKQQLSTTFISRGNSGSIVSDYELDDQAIEVRSPTGAEDFFF